MHYLTNILTYPSIGRSKRERKSIDKIAREVLDGKWGNGLSRRKQLKLAGYDYDAVQKMVNELVKK